MITRGDVEIVGFVQCEVPYVLGARREVDRRTPGGIERRLGWIFDRVFVACGCGLGGGFLRGLMLDLIHLAVGSSARIDHPGGSSFEGLNLEFLRFEDDGGLT